MGSHKQCNVQELLAQQSLGFRDSRALGGLGREADVYEQCGSQGRVKEISHDRPGRMVLQAGMGSAVL